MTSKLSKLNKKIKNSSDGDRHGYYVVEYKTESDYKDTVKYGKEVGSKKESITTLNFDDAKERQTKLLENKENYAVCIFAIKDKREVSFAFGDKYYAKGGQPKEPIRYVKTPGKKTIDNQYQYENPWSVWKMWTVEQRTHFLKDHFSGMIKKEVEKISNNSILTTCPKDVIDAVGSHVKKGEYEFGGQPIKSEDVTEPVWVKGFAISSDPNGNFFETEDDAIEYINNASGEIGNLMSKEDIYVTRQEEIEDDPSDGTWRVVDEDIKEGNFAKGGDLKNKSGKKMVIDDISEIRKMTAAEIVEKYGSFLKNGLKRNEFRKALFQNGVDFDKIQYLENSTEFSVIDDYGGGSEVKKRIHNNQINEKGINDIFYPFCTEVNMEKKEIRLIPCEYSSEGRGHQTTPNVKIIGNELIPKDKTWKYDNGGMTNYEIPNIQTNEFAKGGERNTRYWIMLYTNDDSLSQVIYETEEYDKDKIQKIFDDNAKKMKVGEILEYGKSDKGGIYPSILMVEMTENGLKIFTRNGLKRYHPKFKKGGITNNEIPNIEANAYSENHLPFKGYELEGKMINGGDYVVLSHGHYSLWFWCKTENKWYGNKDKYNVLAAKQMTQSRPDWNATMLSHSELVDKMKPSHHYDLGGAMIDDGPLRLDNTASAHAGDALDAQAQL